MTYRTIVADPPWAERGGGQCKRGADRHYEVMSEDRIVETIRGSGVWAPDRSGAHLYLWVTNNHLLDGLWVMQELEFRYVTNLCWAKDRFGLGQYFRGQHELCLFGVMGKLMTQDRSCPTLVHAKRRAHSQKPDEFMALVERASPRPRLELFARSARPGWDSWP